LDKADSFTDWERRPLTERQIAYALDDVRYLQQCYARLVELLEARGRLEWLYEDLREMGLARNYDIDPTTRWLNVKKASSLHGNALAILKRLATWRELEAQRHDIPRKWVMPDEMIIAVAKQRPKNTAELYGIRGSHERLGERSSEAVLECVEKGMRDTPPIWPHGETKYKGSEDNSIIISLMQAVIHYYASMNDISSALLATTDELKRLACGKRDGERVLSGWRYDIIGKPLLDMLEGRTSLSLQDGKLKVTNTAQ
jgi:ribonuclease D